MQEGNHKEIPLLTVDFVSICPRLSCIPPIHYLPPPLSGHEGEMIDG